METLVKEHQRTQSKEVLSQTEVNTETQEVSSLCACSCPRHFPLSERAAERQGSTFNRFKG